MNKYFESISPKSSEDESKLAGHVLIATGGGLAIIGFNGIDKHEAKRPEDAIASTDLQSLGISEQYLTPADIPYIGVLALGATLTVAGVYNAFFKKRS